MSVYVIRVEKEGAYEVAAADEHAAKSVLSNKLDVPFECMETLDTVEEPYVIRKLPTTQFRYRRK